MLCGVVLTKEDIVCWNPLQAASRNNPQPSLNFSLTFKNNILFPGGLRKKKKKKSVLFSRNTFQLQISDYMLEKPYSLSASLTLVSMHRYCLTIDFNWLLLDINKGHLPSKQHVCHSSLFPPFEYRVSLKQWRPNPRNPPPPQKKKKWI